MYKNVYSKFFHQIALPIKYVIYVIICLIIHSVCVIFVIQSTFIYKCMVEKFDVIMAHNR